MMTYRERLLAIQWVTKSAQFNVDQQVQLGDAIAAFNDCIDENGKLTKERDLLLRERDAYATAMGIALTHGIFANKQTVKSEIERVLKPTQDERLKGGGV